MKILVIGSGGREHALCWAFEKSKYVKKIYCANGNAGIAEIAECLDIKPDNIGELTNFAEEKKIDLTFVGGETTLALGIVDEFKKRNLKIIGVSKKAAQLESSKSFAKDFMARHHIPTARYQTAFSTLEAIEILESGNFGGEDSPVVVKADGLAAGKGVIVAQNRAEAKNAIYELETIVGKDALEKIVLEECLTGREVSLIMFTDGENFALMPPVRDHKRIGEGDTGANTGGMGTVSDQSLLTFAQTDKIINEIIIPTLQGSKSEGFPIQGILFLGLMLTEKGARVLEYNVRFGDPETQVILVRLNTDLVEICQAMDSQKLDEIKIEWKNGCAACVVLASEGYPQKAQTGQVIHGLKNTAVLPETVVFHAGTAKNENGEFITAGGRVLGVTATADNLENALNKSYQAVRQINWEGMQYRGDIGK